MILLAIGDGMRLEATPEIEELRRKVRAFIAEHSPGEKTHAGVRAPSPELMPAIREWTAALYTAGYLGIDWPAEHGGRPDAHMLEPFVVAEELARARAWPPIGGGELAAAAIIDFGTDAQRAHFLPRIRSAQDVWCQLFSEPGAGSDLAGLQTRACRDGDSFIVDGQKVWTTNGQHADVGYLLARTDQNVSKHRGITAFAMDMNSPGVDVRPLREITGTADFNEVFLSGVVIPADRVIGQVNDGWRIAMSSLGHERAGVATFGVELHRVLDDLVHVAETIEVDGRPSLEDSSVRQALGRFSAEVAVNDLMSKLSQSTLVAGVDDPADAPLGKIFFSELNLALLEFGVGLQGSDGILVEGDPDGIAGGWWQDAFLYSRAYTISGGANELLKTVVGERALGLPRDPA